MRLLVLDHFFEQDIDALRTALRPGDELRVMDYRELRDEAMRIFPASVAETLEAFTLDEHAARRERYAAVLRELLEDRFASWPFDAFVVPSDSFFYVRAAGPACRALGIPFLIAQKETTIDPYTMQSFSEEIRRFAPMVADHMTVCSEHHKEFWVRSGADPDAITVTGQPRFDPLVNDHRPPADPPVVLFLSYIVDAYHPDFGSGEQAWERLHRETEEGLRTLAEDGWRVLIKPHPQQDVRGMRKRFRTAFGPLARDRVALVPGGADVRSLIRASDAVVGFQSTAMLEAMLAGGPVAFTGWDPEAQRLSGGMIPFHEWHDVLDVVERAGDLAPVVTSRRGWRADDATAARRRQIAEGYLGPLDGRAARRTLDLIARHVAAAEEAQDAGVDALRDRLRARRRPVRPGRLTRAARRAAGRRVTAVRAARAARRVARVAPTTRESGRGPTPDGVARVAR